MAARKVALITGITGQDGSYLAELLIDKGYEVHGVIRRASTFNTGRIDHVFDKVQLHYGDMTDPSSLMRIVSECEPDEVYNLAAQSHVRVSFDIPAYTYDSIAMGTLHLLEAVRQVVPHARFYQASSSEMWGNADADTNDWSKPFAPCSPYGCAKLAAHHQAINHRNSYGMFTACGILFNHESPRRGETFVTRKITKAVARIEAGLQDKLYLGNLDSYRDWGYAKEYVEAMWLMLQKDEPIDCIIATEESHSIREFVIEAFSAANLNWEQYVEIDPRLFRPSELHHLRGVSDGWKIGWKPRTTFAELVQIMLDADREQTGVRRGLIESLDFIA